MLTSNMSLADLLKAKVDHCMQQAERKYQQKFEYQDIQLNIRGKAAGQVRFERSWVQDKKPVLRFNPVMLAQYKEKFIDEVVPHECAHLVVHQRYRTQSYRAKKIKPHGLEWQRVMCELYQLEPRVTHCFETVSPKRDKYLYRCACPDVTHRLSVVRHNKVVREKTGYRCKNCSDTLVYQGEKEI